MNILAFHNTTGSRKWRLENIANYVNTRTNHEMYVTSHKNWAEDTLGADIVVAQMWQNPKGVHFCKKNGSKVVYEADDIILGVGGKDREKLMVLSKAQEEMTKETIASCDVVTVTTDVLADHYKQWNKNVYVLPNYMDFMWWGEPLTTRRFSQDIRLGWAGSYSHHEDLLMIKPVIKRILDQYPFVRFVYCGYGGMGTSASSTLTFGKDIFSDIPLNRREYYLGVEADYWPNKLKTLYFDIGIAPLVDDEFNAGKSAIKWMEYATVGVPGVFSDTNVYRGTVQHGVNGYLARTEEDWYRYLSKLILDETIRKAIARQALLDVLGKYNLEDHYKKWLTVYESIL